MDDKKRLRIVIRQMVQHNNDHMQDFITWSNFAEENGMNAVRGILDEAGKHADAAATALKNALDFLN
jgi:hypothetical protein